MNLSPDLFIAGTRRAGRGDPVHAVAPATGERIGPAFGGATAEDVADACAAAATAFRPYRAAGLERRAAFLEAIAEEIEALGDTLIERAVLETALPPARILGERGRTVGQLRLFARVVRQGDWQEVRIDPALPDRQPAPRPDIRMGRIGLGPVAVFGASNFPLAFSVAGGDTASALAAGCPVVVKAHPGHPGTSALVAEAVDRAVARCAMPAGLFSMVAGADHAVGAALVTDERICAVGFTGSRAGGLALMALAAARPRPIPVYAEMSSINPVLVFPHALASRAEAVANAYVASLTLGGGQFCTNPGLLLLPEGPGAETFLRAVESALAAQPAATLLSPAIHAAHQAGQAALAATPGVDCIGTGAEARGPCEARPTAFMVDAARFDAIPHLSDEIFGPTGLVVRCPDAAAMAGIMERIEGQLTIALHIDAADEEAAAALLPVLEEKAGRLLVNGFGTGVEVCDAMVHGGPFPATSDGRSTSVGSYAIERFLRPVCYQDMPPALLPEMLRDRTPQQA